MLRKAVLVILVTSALLTGSAVPLTAHQLDRSLAAMPPTTVVYIVGDSIVNGQYSPDWWRDGFFIRARDRICGMYCATQVVKVSHGGGCLVATDCAGPPAIEWMLTEVFDATPAPTTVLLEIGINDLGRVSDLQIVTAYSYLLNLAISKGIRLFLGTLNPTCANSTYWNNQEAQRVRISQWIRDNFGPHTMEFDGVLRGGNGRLNPIFAMGGCAPGTDSLHPNALAAVRMADMINLAYIV